MAEFTMTTVDGIRYRPEDVPEPADVVPAPEPKKAAPAARNKARQPAAAGGAGEPGTVSTK